MFKTPPPGKGGNSKPPDKDLEGDEGRRKRLANAKGDTKKPRSVIPGAGRSGSVQEEAPPRGVTQTSNPTGTEFQPLHSSTRAGGDDRSNRQQKGIDRATASDTRRGPIITRGGVHPPLQPASQGPLLPPDESDLGGVDQVAPGGQQDVPQQQELGARPKVGHAGGAVATIKDTVNDPNVNVVDLGSDHEADRVGGDALHGHVDDDADELDEASSLPGNQLAFGQVQRHEDNLADEYDTDDEVENLMNDPVAQFRRLLMKLRPIFESVNRFDSSIYKIFPDYIGSLKGAKDDLRIAGIIIATGNHPLFLSLLEDKARDIILILNRLVPNFKIVLHSFKSNPGNSQDEKDMLMSHFKLMETYQRACCKLVRKITGTDVDVKSVSSFTSYNDVPDTQYVEKRNIFIDLLARDMEDFGLLTQMKMIGLVPVSEYDLKSNDFNRNTILFEEEYRGNLLKAWTDRRIGRIATDNQLCTEHGRTAASTMVSVTAASSTMASTIATTNSVPASTIMTTSSFGSLMSSTTTSQVRRANMFGMPPPQPLNLNRRVRMNLEPPPIHEYTPGRAENTSCARINANAPPFVPSNAPSSITAANMSTSVQQANTMNDLLDVTKNLVQMQVNSLSNSSSSKGSEYSEFKEKALPGNRKDAFYHGLPSPWNVLPDKEGRYQDELTKIKNLLSDAGKDGALLRKFDGTEEEYFDWRSVVIHYIHERNVSIKDKYNNLCQSLKRGADTFIDGLLLEIDPSHDNYKNLIEQLEFHYGGDRRAYTHALKKLKKLKKLNEEDFDSLTDFFGAVSHYIAFCERHGLSNCLLPGQSASDVLKGFMSVGQLRDMFEYCKTHRIMEPKGSLYQAKAFLFQKLTHNRDAREVYGYQRLPSNRSSNRAGTGSGARGYRARVHHGHTGDADGASDDEGKVPAGAADDSFDDSDDYYDPQNIYYCDEDELFSNHGDDDDEAYVSSLSGPIVDGMITNDDQFRVLMARKVEFAECVLCKGEKHLLFRCPKYLEKSLENRMEYVRKSSRCYNCLSLDHGSKDCPSRNRCLNCRNKHHSTICQRSAKDAKDKTFMKKFVKNQTAYNWKGRGRGRNFQRSGYSYGPNKESGNSR